jgi:hypothetical protein
MQSGSDHLVSAMPKFSGGISPLLKKLVVLLQLLRDMLEQLDAHLKMMTKIALRICWILQKIALHQLFVAFYPFLPQLLSTENGTTMLQPFIYMHSQQYGHVFFFLKIPFLIGYVEIQLPSLLHQIGLLVELARACNSDMVSELPGSNHGQHSIKINIYGLPKKIQ